VFRYQSVLDAVRVVEDVGERGKIRARFCSASRIPPVHMKKKGVYVHVLMSGCT